MPDSNEVVTDPRFEKRTRRRFRVAEKKRLLNEADALPYGEIGCWLRRQALYAGQLSTWRKDLAEHGESGMATLQPGRKPADPRYKELERLKKSNAKLKLHACVTEQLVDGENKEPKS